MKRLTNSDLNKKFDTEVDYSEKELDILFEKKYTCDYCDKSIFEKYSGTCDFPDISTTYNSIRCYECDTNKDSDICPLCEDRINVSLEDELCETKHWENGIFIPYFYLEEDENKRHILNSNYNYENFLEGIYKVTQTNPVFMSYNHEKLKISDKKFKKLVKKVLFEISNGNEICMDCAKKYKLNDIEVII